MKKLSFIIIALVFCSMFLEAQSPKREMRATWLATVWQLDWPSGPVPALPDNQTSAITTQKNSLITILNRLQNANVNAVFFQVRPMCDAFYQSSYEPWSQFVSSNRGDYPGYDPLQFAIEEAHKRGIELHAWINPYRYSSSAATHGNLSTDYVNTHPNWLMDYSGTTTDRVLTKILNPGIPEVTQRITDIVAEIVTNYDVDGIVFDDYFYMSRTTDAMDQAQFNAYNPDGLSRQDWRRQNVNKMIESVYNKIQETKPDVIFGVSPAGVAASSASVAAKYGVPRSPVGSDWQYNDIFSDPLAWLSEGTVDYISPQIYWVIGHNSNDYAALANWWSGIGNHFGKHFYSSHSLAAMTGPDRTAQKTVSIAGEEISTDALSLIELSAVNKNESTLQRSASAMDFTYSEVWNQIDCNRNSDINDAPGSVFYSTKHVNLSFSNQLKANRFTQPALSPAIGWKKMTIQEPISAITLAGQQLSWTHSGTNVRYAVYAVPNANRNDAAVFSMSEYLLGVSYTKQYQLPTGISNSTHKLAVSVLDRYGNKFAPRVMDESSATSTAAQLTYPANAAEIFIPANFTWNAVSDADYVWELALDNSFTNIICARETANAEFYSGLQTNLNANTTYYWRVRTRKVNAKDTYSEVREFKGTKFSVTTPAAGSTDLSITPTITWINVSTATDYTVEISTTAQFQEARIVFRQTTTNTSIVVPANKLIGGTSYYVRVIMTSGGNQSISEAVNFTTKELPVSVPTIISPTDNTVIDGNQISVTWNIQTSRGFRVELSEDSNFPSRNVKVQQTDAYTYTTVYENLVSATYYIRMAASMTGGLTAYSDVVSVQLQNTASLNDMNDDNFVCRIYNDAHNKQYLKVKTNISSPATLSIYAVSGALLMQQKEFIQAGTSDISLNTGTVQRGIYILKIAMGTEEKVLKFQID